MGRRAVVLVTVLLMTGPLTGPVAAQDPTSTSTTVVGATDDGIIPEPNSGDAPSEAGDRGGALQLALLVLVVAAIAGAVLALVRQSRRRREG